VRTAHARNLVLLLSDMKGFTARTSEQTREENQRMLALHDALMLPVVRGFGGRKVKSIGDALLASFESPTDAVLCAMAIQDRFAEFNLRAGRAEAIEVRISLSQGEVRLTRGDVTGEPVQLAALAGAAAEAGDVVLTDAVYLSMNKSEAPTEVLGERPLPSGGSIRLRRAVRSAGPSAPYGRRALRRLGPLPDPSRTLALRHAVTRGARFLRRRAAWAAVVLVLAGAAAGERARAHTPLARAEALLFERQPLAALAELDKLADTPDARAPSVALVRGKAFQAVGNLGLAFSDFAVALEAGSRDEAALRALADDLDAESFPRSYRPALLKLLGEKAGRSAAPAVRRLLGSPRARTRRDAMQVLELAGAVTDADRLEVARADLADAATPCELRRQGVQRLEMVRDAAGQKLLEATAASKLCASREASDALRRLSRALQAAR
jgi:serine/threonine-protein kinase